MSAPVTKSKKPRMPVEQLQSVITSSTTSKPLTTKKEAFGSGNGPPTQNYDLDRTYTVEPDKTYSMAFAKKQAKAAGQIKRDRTPPQSVDNEAGISLEGRSLDRDSGVNKVSQPKKKPRKVDALKGNLPPPKLRSVPLGYESGVERRPSIERGGTNTIEMEVSGVGSHSGSRGKENLVIQDQSVSQLQTTKENSGGRKRQKHNSGEEDTDATMLSAHYIVSKRPVPPPSVDQPTNPSLSAPAKDTQKRAKRSRQHSHPTSTQESGYGPAGDETPRGSNPTRRTNTIITDMESSMNGGGGSPCESQLIELQPLHNPEQGLKESIAKIGKEDWSAKCDGMIGVRQVALYHPDVLQPQLHSVVLAVQKEVSPITLY